MAYDDLFESVRTCALLVLDDLGTQSSTAWAQEKLFQVLNHRYNARLPTVVTTNHRLEELDERTREAITAATQKVIAEFDRFGESLLGKEAYWQKASGRRSAARPDTDVVALDVRPGDDKG